MAERNDWRRTLAASVWTLTTMMAVVIVSRRLGGHFSSGIHPAAATLLAALLTGLNLAAAVLLQSTRAQPAQTHWFTPAAKYLLTLIPPFVLGAAVIPAGSAAGLSALAVLSLLCGAGMLAAGCDFRVPRSTVSQRSSTSPIVDAGRNVQSSPLQGAEMFDEDELDEEDLDEVQSFSQSMSRTTQPDGSETIEGTIVLPFAAGQQIGVAHLPFSPPLASPPLVECHLLSDAAVRIRVTTKQAYGVRLEAKRTGEPREPAQITVGYVVRAAAPRRRAA